MRLTWHDYKYYPYERELALREMASLLGNSAFGELPGGLSNWLIRSMTDSLTVSPTFQKWPMAKAR